MDYPNEGSGSSAEQDGKTVVTEADLIINVHMIVSVRLIIQQGYSHV